MTLRNEIERAVIKTIISDSVVKSVSPMEVVLLDKLLSLLPDNILDADVVVGLDWYESNHIHGFFLNMHSKDPIIQSVLDKLAQALKDKK